VAAEESHWQFMNTSDLIGLHASGVAIGNHSRRHRNLARCGDDELVDEVHDSKLALEAALGAPVPTFAYPDGRRSRRVAVQVACDHELAMATWTNRPALTPMAVCRYPAGRRLEDLEEVLRAGYPTRCRLRRPRWALRPLLLEHALRLGLSRRHLADQHVPAAPTA
jgi:peptidoglycan/xylan/chitin deacetylase (PgdA/CDA1 family)